MREFRLGALEYEMSEDANGKKIFLHIPSDADLSERSVSHSIGAAKSFFEKYYPDFAGVAKERKKPAFIRRQDRLGAREDEKIVRSMQNRFDPPGICAPCIRIGRYGGQVLCAMPEKIGESA